MILDLVSRESQRAIIPIIIAGTPTRIAIISAMPILSLMKLSHSGDPVPTCLFYHSLHAYGFTLAKIQNDTLAGEMGTRQQTISEWEKGQYQPRGASARLLSIIADRSHFEYRAGPK